MGWKTVLIDISFLFCFVTFSCYSFFLTAPFVILDFALLVLSIFIFFNSFFPLSFCSVPYIENLSPDWTKNETKQRKRKWIRRERKKGRKRNRFFLSNWKEKNCSSSQPNLNFWHVTKHLMIEDSLLNVRVFFYLFFCLFVYSLCSIPHESREGVKLIFFVQPVSMLTHKGHFIFSKCAYRKLVMRDHLAFFQFDI